MKIRALWAVALWAAVSSTAAADQPSDDLSRAAAAQLERLAPFRRYSSDFEDISASGKKLQQRSTSSKKSSSAAEDSGLTIPIDFTELFKIFSDPQDSGQKQASRDKRNEMRLTPERMQKLDKYADKIMQDKRVQSYMQERIKRDGYGGQTSYGPPAYGDAGYGGGSSGSGSGGSGAFVSGIAGQLVGSVVGLSSSASRGSSSGSFGHSPKPVYGPPTAYYSYGKDTFSVWDFKKAILNTLIQAVKAIGGGVLALKGQLIKGSGFLVSTKGRIISSAGEAITGLGKNLAASAIVQPPKPVVHPTYTYGTPVAHVVSDTHYDGPPPNTDAYHSTFGAASDDGHVDAGLLIAQPTPSVEIQSSHLETDHHLNSDHAQSDYDNSQHSQSDYHGDEHVPVEDLESHSPQYNIKDVVSQLTHTSADGYHADNLKHPESQSADEPAIPGNTLQLQDHNQDHYEQYPPLGNGGGASDGDKTIQHPPKPDSPVDFKTQHEYTNNPYEYSTLPFKTNYNPLPSKYGSPEVAGYPQHKYLPARPYTGDSHRSPDIQIEISNHDITGFETGGYTSGYSQHIRHTPSQPGLHVVAMHAPLKIPILGPHSPSGYGYKLPAAYPPGHANSISGIGKHPKYGPPNVDVQQSIEYELRKRRDHSRIYRI